MTDILNSDIDAQETSEWLDALATILEDEGTERAQFIIKKLTAGFINVLSIVF